MIFRSSIDVAELTNPRDQIKVFVDGDPLPKEKFRVIAQSNAIDLKLSPDIDPAASVTAVVDKVSTGRLDLTEKRIEEITLNETLQSGHQCPSPAQKKILLMEALSMCRPSVLN